MSKVKKLIPFDALEVPLEGTNLIEASAGTGKTYSIAILVLRLLLESKLTIKEILMVTFTKAAVAELEERVRLFVRTAYQVSQGVEVKDDKITRIVERAIGEQNADVVSTKLKDALNLLDETAVMTIHSFCQQTLTEFAFETGQPFGAELMADISLLLESEVNQFWRSHITVLPIAFIQFFEGSLTRKAVQTVIKNYLAGKPVSGYDPAIEYVLDEGFHLAMQADLQVDVQIAQLENDLLESIAADTEALKEICSGNRYAKISYLPLLSQPSLFLNAILYNKKPLPGYLPKLLPLIMVAVDEIKDLIKVRSDLRKKWLNYIYCAAITEVGESIQSYKRQHNMLAFDDLIGGLYNSLCKTDNAALVSALQLKYGAVFIDEFQDTDQMQYEIFKNAFGAKTIVFYIGDPKQSIYAFRNADIATYLKASAEVDNAYGMNTNFRSSANYIEAMNTFFLPKEGFDTFNLKSEMENGFEYHPVSPPLDNKKGELSDNNGNCTAITISTVPNNGAGIDAITAQVIALLSNAAYRIGDSSSGTDRNIIPSDIGILVRGNKEAVALKRSLSTVGIPSIVIGDAKILESPEAKEVQYLLEAMLVLNRSAINRALLSSFTGYDRLKILALTDGETIERFKRYKSEWERDGVYKALFSFIADFNVQNRLLHSATKSGERIITNLYQLVELLYKNQSVKGFSPIELLDWLKRGIKNKEAVGDEYEQRIESDEESVRIMTIHKSKGLQFNIVLSPSLDFGNSFKSDKFYQIKQSGADYVMIQWGFKTEEENDLYNVQNEQENRRLLYVTLTRAVYKSFIYKKESVKSDSTLKPFLDILQTLGSPWLEFKAPLSIPDNYHYEPSVGTRGPVATVSSMQVPVEFNLLQKNWGRLSYTMLAAKTQRARLFNTHGAKSEYDQFVFHKLARGNKTGNMLHYIFEHIYFEKSDRWPEIIAEAITLFAPLSREQYGPWLLMLVESVMAAKVTMGNHVFALSQVSNDRRIHEFEFDFPVDAFNSGILQSFSKENRMIQPIYRSNLEGVMNGKIDMLFEQGNQFFILDWKSTFLGDQLEDYELAGLQEAMNQHNYHLQYLIYTVATVKYLESRLSDFDYERDFGGVLYFFLRGIREGKTSGIYKVKPTKCEIDRLGEIFLRPENLLDK